MSQQRRVSQKKKELQTKNGQTLRMWAALRPHSSVPLVEVSDLKFRPR